MDPEIVGGWREGLWEGLVLCELQEGGGFFCGTFGESGDGKRERRI